LVMVLAPHSHRCSEYTRRASFCASASRV